MLHTQQIEEAIKTGEQIKYLYLSLIANEKTSVKEELANKFNVLLSLAQAVLDCKGWPEERKCHKHDTPKAGTIMLSTCEACDYNFPFNEALSACKLAHAKNCQECRDNVPSEDEIIRVLQIGILPTAIARDDATGIFKDGDNVKTLAQAIHTLITGKMKGEMKGEGR